MVAFGSIAGNLDIALRLDGGHGDPALETAAAHWG